MFFILGSDGKEYGPVTAGKLHEWIAGGRANQQTKARRANETEWKAIADIPELAQFSGTGGNPGTPPPAAAVESPIPVATATPASHPVVPVPMTGDASAIAADLIARTAKIDVFDCLTQSFELWKSNFWPLVGVTLLIVLIQGVIGMIPFLGMISGFFLNGIFYGGLYYYYLGLVRGQPREVGDAFAGFSRTPVPLMLATMLSTVLILVVVGVSCAPLLMLLIKSAVANSHAMPHFTPPMLAGFFVGFCALLYLSVSWAFTFILIIDRGLGPWTAMEVSRRVVGRQWFRVFFVMLLGGILSMLGLIGLIIGVLFTLPLMFGAMVYAYEAMCNPPAPGPGA
jgi:hypothetical protein